MNVNKGKTNALLFGTTIKVANRSSDFKVCVNYRDITKKMSYKYLEIQIDGILNMNTFFSSASKKHPLDLVPLRNYEENWV